MKRTAIPGVVRAVAGYGFVALDAVALAEAVREAGLPLAPRASLGAAASRLSDDVICFVVAQQPAHAPGTAAMWLTDARARVVRVLATLDDGAPDAAERLAALLRRQTRAYLDAGIAVPDADQIASLADGLKLLAAQLDLAAAAALDDAKMKRGKRRPASAEAHLWHRIGCAYRELFGREPALSRSAGEPGGPTYRFASSVIRHARAAVADSEVAGVPGALAALSDMRAPERIAAAIAGPMVGKSFR